MRMTGSDLPVFSYEIVNEFPHDPDAFTQGLVIREGFFYESTGGYGKSSLRRIHVETGVIYLKEALPQKLFGEGLAWFQGMLFQLTWRSGVGRIYDGESFRLKGEFSFKGQGWGLTHNGTHLIRSDGSNRLVFFDPHDFSKVGEIRVKAEGNPVRFLNELEFVKNEIWANVYQTDRIVRIHPESGEVTGWIDLTGLRPEKKGRDPEGVLNGIAFDPSEDRIFVTGKNWPKIYEIRLKRDDS